MVCGGFGKVLVCLDGLASWTTSSTYCLVYAHIGAVIRQLTPRAATTTIEAMHATTRQIPVHRGSSTSLEVGSTLFKTLVYHRKSGVAGLSSRTVV